MLDPDLLKSINLGRCFAFIGAGPSAELGYPSWGVLAERVRDHVLSTVPAADQPSYEQFLRNREYPALLRQAEVDLGSRQALIAAVRSALRPSGTPPPRPVYQYLAKWPFACYLTTNFDDEIHDALGRQSQHLQVRHNSATDLSLLRDGVSNLIVKVHSDLEHPNDVVITSMDYDRILSAPEGDHIRQKLRQVFEMFDVFIIGHSMSDPDLQLILRTAKHTASALHPIHMLLADATNGQVREFREQYNIRLSTYENRDGTHRNLRRLIAGSDSWTCERGVVSVPALPVSEDEIDAASSLLIFQRLKAMGDTSTGSSTLDCLLLFALASASAALSRDDLAQRPAVASLAGSADGIRAIDGGLARLVAAGMAAETAGAFMASPLGRTRADEVMAQRRLEEDQAFGQFELALNAELPDVSAADRASARKALRNGLVGAFRSRGIAMANVIMADQSLSADELSDLFRELSKHASSLAGDSLRSAFLEAAHAFLVEPTGPQKAYLASVSQGFFLYHMAGMDPSFMKTRRDLFANTCWFIDSSVLLPLLAVGCHNHEYAVDLFGKLRGADATLLTTEDLLKEAGDHLDWAINFVQMHSTESPDFRAAVMVREGFKQNLFLDGYVRQSAEGVTGTFADYLARITPSGSVAEALSAVCNQCGITALHASEVDGFRQDDWGDIEDVKAQLVEHRRSRGTFRGESQVQAEAEVLVLIRNIRQGKYKLGAGGGTSRRVYFVSQSRALDAVNQEDRIVTWTPEAVYRYVSSLPGQELRADLLQECMLHEYFYAGVSFVDKPRYVKFFGPSIRQAKISYREQVDGYLQQTEQTHRRNDYDLAFDSTPDLEKPFFVAQMGWDLARRTVERAATTEQHAKKAVGDATAQARDAEKRAREAEGRAEAERRARITAEQKAAHLRHLTDPKYVRKQAKQAKKRKRRK